MKNLNKVMLLVFGICLVMLLVPQAAQAQAMKLPKNGNYGYQLAMKPAPGMNGVQFKEGESYTFNYAFKSSAAMDQLQIVLVDCCEQTGWDWLELSGYEMIEENIKANAEVKGSITFKIVKTSTNTSNDANQLCILTSDSKVRSEPTLTFTTFEFKKN